MTTSPPETLVVDASALVEALLGTPFGSMVRARTRGCVLVAPAHIDAEVLSALGRLNRAGELTDELAGTAVANLATAPIRRHQLAGVLEGAWQRRERLRLADALYVELAGSLGAALVTTDARLSRADDRVELIAAA